MGLGTVIFLLFIALVIYIYYYLKKKFGSISSGVNSVINSLNPVNVIGDKVKSIF